MVDKLLFYERSWCMLKIWSKDMNIEFWVRKVLYLVGFRFCLYCKDLLGFFDLVFLKYFIVVFVNGCFWYGYDCKKVKIFVINIEFWKRKIEINIFRDKKNKDFLEEVGWYYYVIWECCFEEEIFYLINYLLEE